MRKIIALLMAFLLVASLGGCITARSQVKDDLESTLDAIITGENVELCYAYTDGTMLDIGAADDELSQAVAKRTHYNINSIDIEGESAVADVDVFVPDLGGLVDDIKKDDPDITDEELKDELIDRLEDGDYTADHNNFDLDLDYNEDDNRWYVEDTDIEDMDEVINNKENKDIAGVGEDENGDSSVNKAFAATVDELVEQYGAFDRDQKGTVSMGNLKSGFDAEGVMSSTVFDFDDDGDEELLVIFGEKLQLEEYVGDRVVVRMNMYELVKGKVRLEDSVEFGPYFSEEYADNFTRFLLNDSDNKEIELIVTQDKIDGRNVILCEVTYIVPTKIGGLTHAWILEYDQGELRYHSSFTQTDATSVGRTFMGYVFENGKCTEETVYINELPGEPDGLYDDYETASEAFFRQFGLEFSDSEGAGMYNDTIDGESGFESGKDTAEIMSLSNIYTNWERDEEGRRELLEMMPYFSIDFVTTLKAQPLITAKDKNDNQASADLSKELFGLIEGGFAFTSGVGGWATIMEVDSDGSFEGEYHDSEYGPGGSDDYFMYYCEFEGSFGDVRKVNDYTYSMKVESLNYENTPDTEGMEDGIKCKYAEAYGLADADEVLVYTPDAPVSELPQAFKGWTFVTEDDGLLGFYGLYNVNEELGWKMGNNDY